jgi:hypothetical protein
MHPVRTLVLALLVLAACTMPAPVAHAQAAAPRNLLGNPGFERGLRNHEWMPADWDTSTAGLPTVFFGRDSFSVRSGRYAVHVANTSTLFPMSHNWSQTLLVGPEAWGRTARFRVWTRSNGVQGRAYVLLQAYRDTITVRAKVWNVDREEARRRVGLAKVDDPAMDLGWHRVQFDEPQTGWVQREASVHIPPLTNVLFVRVGMQGTGQLLLDDASLTLEASPPPRRVAPGQNLLADASFEQGAGLPWEMVVPPYEGARIDIDSTVAREGRCSVRLSQFNDGLVQTRMGVTQVFEGRALAGRRVRASAHFRGDSLRGTAYVKIWAQGPRIGVQSSPGRELASGTFDWKLLDSEFVVPRGTEMLWAWYAINAPAEGTLWIDDARFEVVPDAPAPAVAPPARR